MYCMQCQILEEGTDDGESFCSLTQDAVNARCKQALRNICECKGPLHHHRLVFPNSSLHPLQVKPHCKQRRSWGIWASTSRRPARARSFATSWEGRLCLWGRFSPTHLLTAPLWRGYKDFQTNSMMRNRFFFFLLYLINRSTKSKHKASVYGLKSLVYGALIERLCRVCLTVTRTWVRL